MSDYRFDIDEHNGIAFLHVMIDPGEAYHGIVSTHIPLSEIQNAMKRHLASQVFQALGTASMCWEETPQGVFDSQQAIRLGQNLMQTIKDITGYDATEARKFIDLETEKEV